MTVSNEEMKKDILSLIGIIENPPQHVSWGAGESDCPPELKAPNGELHTLQCKKCGGNMKGFCTPDLSEMKNKYSV